MVQDDWNQGFVTGFVSGLSTSGPSSNSFRFRENLSVVLDVQCGFSLAESNTLNTINTPTETLSITLT